ncbi:MAG: PAS domain-containing protein, partial [Candidatus Thermoplasmatota archaeon]|nr:PAS domain-containing protein [Candidatus Thermoplasmatota archaeon]
MQNKPFLHKKPRYNKPHRHQQRTTPPELITNKKGEITDVNQAFCTLFHIQKEHLIGHALEDLDFITPESRKTIMLRNIQQLIGKQQPHFTFTARTPEGTLLSLQVKTTPHIHQGQPQGEKITIITPTIVSSPPTNKTPQQPNSPPTETPEQPIKKPQPPQPSADAIKERDTLIAQLKNQRDILQNEITTRNTIIHQLNTQLTQQSTQLLHTNNNAEQLTNHLTQKDHQLRTINKQIIKHQKTIDQQHQQLTTLEQQHKKHIEQIQQQLTDTQTQIQQHHHQEQHLKNLLQTKDTELNQQQKQLQELQTHLQ